MNRFQRYVEKNKHPCAKCGARVRKNSKICQQCDRERRRIEMSKNPVRLRHGFTIKGAKRPEYYIWASMVQRCTNPKAKQYEDYGGRGIKICERWLVFDNFIADMGSRPEGVYPSGRARYTIDRKENDGNYEPGNVRWATYLEQARNKSSHRMVEYRGKTQPLAVWCEDLGINYKTAHTRLSRGWTVQQTFEGSR